MVILCSEVVTQKIRGGYDFDIASFQELLSYIFFLDYVQIRFKQGMEMLNIFKNHTRKTSLLDDFMYYENRQKILQEEKSRLLIRSYPLFVPVLDPPRKLNCDVDRPPSEEKIAKHTDAINSDKTMPPSIEQVSSNPVVSGTSKIKGNTRQYKVEAKDDITSTLTIGSLTINPKQGEAIPTAVATEVGMERADVVTVGTMPVKLNGFSDSSRIIKVGTVPLDLKAQQLVKEGAANNGGFHD